MEGPYRDLGSGFARLMGVEGARRTPSRITHLEDALFELLRNAADAGAGRIYVASTLKDRRYRTLTVIDDGHGIPDSHRDLILQPGVTTRHLNPTTNPEDPSSPHGAGLSLYHIRARSLSTRILSTSSPTAIQSTFDTKTLPERALQSTSRPSKTNLRATLQRFVQETNARREAPNLKAYYGPPNRLLATLLHHRIIHPRGKSAHLREAASRLGLRVSRRSVQRIIRGEVRPVEAVEGIPGVGEVRSRRFTGTGDGGAVLSLGEEESAGIADILRRAARAGYLEVDDLRFESRPGEISVRARVYEPEDEYE